MSQSLRSGQTLEVRIESVAFGGDGVGRKDDLVVFVPFAVTGDMVAIVLTEQKRRYVRGRIERILAASDHRVEPACPYYTRCGGCQYQHIRYNEQLEIKRMQVIEAYKRIGRFHAPPVAEVIPSPKPLFYRGKAEFQIQVNAREKPIAGFMHAASNTVIDVASCALVHESINEAYQTFREDMTAGRARVSDGRKKIIWSAPGEQQGTDGLSGKQKVRYVVRSVKGVHLLVPRRGFFQANDYLVEALVDRVVALCGLTGRETVLDAYCGSGLFSLFLAPSARRIFGVEADSDAVACARMNLRRGGVTDATVFRGDVSPVIQNRLMATGTFVDVLVLDPPRQGLSREMISVIAEMKPPKIVYVSCNPATQARDMRILVDGGYDLKNLQPVDMFPQTAHIEVVGLLER